MSSGAKGVEILFKDCGKFVRKNIFLCRIVNRLTHPAIEPLPFQIFFAWSQRAEHIKSRRSKVTHHIIFSAARPAAE
jgi:hypothetical protein